MKEHPLIFKSDMVRAVLDDRKTQTRRVPVERYRNWKVGDRIWLREGYKIQKEFHSGGDYASIEGIYLADKTRFNVGLTPREWNLYLNRKRRTGFNCTGRFMYKSLARIWLEITGLRVERVQDIGWRDCKAEGITLVGDELVFNNKTQKHSLLRTKFNRLWDSINAKRGYGWDKNPGVKVIEFKRIK